MLFYLFIFLISLCSTFLLTPVVRTFALKIGAIDRPNSRKIHKNAVPRLGGLAIYLGFVISMAFALLSAYFLRMSINYFPILGVMLSSTLILLIGFIDDLMGLSAGVKFFFQLAVAFMVIYFGVHITFLSNPFNGLILLGSASIPLTALWIVGLTNAMNLIDGLDGLASGVAAIASVTLFFVALRTHQVGSAMLLLSLAGGAAGFLRYNFNPASIFLGDSGSLFLGFVLACASVAGVLKSTLVIAFLVPVLILGVPIFDTALAIIRRALAGAPLFEADDRHIHHRLLKAGFSQREAVMAIYFVCILLSLGALVVTFMNFYESLVLLTMIVVVSVAGALRIKESLRARLAGERK
jgi:UDP-GlcNAc:undecaprenyl-phosphate GlcNAc-1-phosphate transferase